MTRTIWILALALITSSTMPAKAASEMTAGDLYDLCNAPAETGGQMACSFFILGVVQGVTFADGSYKAANGNRKEKTVLCVPAGLSQSQMVSVVMDAFKKIFVVFPGDKDLGAAGAFTAAIAQKFPCH
jgi:hypothetical protein